jgi:hypothetical protein
LRKTILTFKLDRDSCNLAYRPGTNTFGTQFIEPARGPEAENTKRPFVNRDLSLGGSGGVPLLPATIGALTFT